MANARIQSSKLVMVFDAGTNEKGQMITESKQIATVRPEVTADALMSTAEAYGTLAEQAVIRTERRDVVVIEA